MSTPLNQNEGTGTPNPQVLDAENSQLKNEFSSSFHKLEPSMGQTLLKKVPKIKKWPPFSGEGELVTARFNTTFPRSAHKWYVKLRQAHSHQSWTWWKIQTINKWANDAWRLKMEKAFEYAKLYADKEKDLPWFCKQKDRLTALYPDRSEFMIHRNILRQCRGDLEHAVKSRNTKKSSAEDIINILEDTNTITRIGSSRLNLKTRFNTPWKDSVDRNLKENSNNMKYRSEDIIRKCRICQRTIHLANKCAKR
ncbi:hypothetical protein O181_008610 [Austropuccinia psidii MF-1]|uniref:Uncharacterized protein n=1 Tax=Austropuccinia psidii MF-1 TaxID=1389203 RepID=A0A9Q3GJ23_9BASI|nr:hypothetical protein [Austropuccinia psidii MF-1]